MEDRDDALWAGLGSIEAFISSPTTSPRPSSPPSAAASPWSWQHLPDGLQVRLDDGEPADHPPDLDLLLPGLNDESKEIQKPCSSSSPSHPPAPTSSAPSSFSSSSSASASAVPKIVKSQPVVTSVKIAKSEPNVAKLDSLVHSQPIIKQESVVKREPLVKRELVLERPKPRVIGAPPPAPTTPKLGVSKPLIQRSPVRVQGTSRMLGRKPLSEMAQKVNDNMPISLKEKREREARQFPKEVLGSLDGTTSAEVRKMNATERELVLYKRKLRNRESARRSRQKRQATLAELQEEIDDLMQVTGRMVEVGIELHEENVRLRDRLGVANAEIKGLRGLYGEGSSTNAGAAALKMKLGG